MRIVGFRKVKIDNITEGDRLRPVDRDHAQALAATMARSGLMYPVEITYAEGKLDRFVLIAGGHRLAAAKLLGWPEIDARLVEFDQYDDPDIARYHESLENIIRNELNPLDRAVTLAACKDVYQRLHPETKHGKYGGRGGKKNENVTITFSKMAANKTGLGRSSIEKYVKLHNDLAPDTIARLSGTEYAGDRGQLTDLAEHDHDLQAQIVDLLLEDGNGISRVKVAATQVDGPKPKKPDTDDARFNRFQSLYLGGSKRFQKRCRDWFQKQLDEAAAQKKRNGKSDDARQIDLEEAIAATETRQ